MTAWRRVYGASPLQLLALLASFALAGYAASKLLSGGHLVNVLAWFALAIIGHDFVLFPLYSLLDRIAGRAAPRRAAGDVNFVRAPAMMSGLLLLVYFPSILGLNASNYRADTSLGDGVYTSRWLLITAGLFLASAVTCALVVRRRSARCRTDARHRGPAGASVAAPATSTPTAAPATSTPDEGPAPAEPPPDPPHPEAASGE
jgi:hypothetical protein